MHPVSGQALCIALMLWLVRQGYRQGQAENTNLRAYAKESDVTSAETFRTAQTETFLGREYLAVVERLNDMLPAVWKSTYPEVDKRNPRRRKVTIRDTSTLYGQRPNDPRVWFLSPYEFVMHWAVRLVSYPITLG